MTSRLSLIIAAATIGREFGFITEAFKDAIILLAVITCLLGPSHFKSFVRTGFGDDTRAGIEKKSCQPGGCGS